MIKRILIADDEPTLVMLAKQKLEARDYLVHTAGNGREAMKVLETVAIDLLILDVVMPLMDGVDVYKELKKSPDLAGIPVIIMTDNRIFRESFEALGVEHFLPKPLEVEKLIQKVDQISVGKTREPRNKQVLLLGSDPAGIASLGGALESHGLVVGRGQDPIDCLNMCLILVPRLVLIDVLLKGDVPAHEVVRALRCFSRLRDMRIAVFVGPSATPVDADSLREARGVCLQAGAHRDIGRADTGTVWNAIHDFWS